MSERETETERQAETESANRMLRNLCSKHSILKHLAKYVRMLGTPNNTRVSEQMLFG